MNYEPNFKDWKVGDLVSHDCDAKSIEYLMRVVAVLPLNLYECEYPNRKPDRSGNYVNHRSALHDPDAFGIHVEDNSWDRGARKPNYEVWEAAHLIEAAELRAERRIAYDFTNTDEFKKIMGESVRARKKLGR